MKPCSAHLHLLRPQCGLQLRARVLQCVQRIAGGHVRLLAWVAVHQRGSRRRRRPLDALATKARRQLSAWKQRLRLAASAKRSKATKAIAHGCTDGYRQHFLQLPENCKLIHPQ